MENWIAVIEISLFSTVPQVAAALYFTLTFWGAHVPNLFRRMAVVTLILTSVFIVNMLWITPMLRLLLSVAVCIITFAATFRDIPLRQRIACTASFVALPLGIEILVSWVTISLQWITPEQLLSDPRKIILYLILANVLIALAAFFMDRFGYAPGKKIIDAISQVKSRYQTGMLILLFLQFVIASSLYYFVIGNFPFIASFTLVVASLLSAFTMLVTIRSVTSAKNRDILSTQETYVEEIDNLFTTIRGQRHDFLNHVQVIQSFVRQGKKEDLERYVSELVGEIVEINDLIQIGHPALAALIKSKMVYAMERRIDFRYSFEGMERMGHSIASVDYVKIAGNLLDNAIEEAYQHPVEERWVDIQGWTDEMYLYLKVTNPGKPLTEELKAKLFVPGFSTKAKDVHSGLGLSIVNERVRFYNGNIQVHDDHAGRKLSFQVKIPLKRKMV